MHSHIEFLSYNEQFLFSHPDVLILYVHVIIKFEKERDVIQIKKKKKLSKIIKKIYDVRIFFVSE